MAKQWLISMEFYTRFAIKGAGSRDGPNRGFVLIDQHPAKFIAEARVNLRRLYAGEETLNRDRADEITAIFSAIEVPEGTLTEDEIDGLS